MFDGEKAVEGGGVETQAFVPNFKLNPLAWLGAVILNDIMLSAVWLSVVAPKLEPTPSEVPCWTPLWGLAYSTFSWNWVLRVMERPWLTLSRGLTDELASYAGLASRQQLVIFTRATGPTPSSLYLHLLQWFAWMGAFNLTSNHWLKNVRRGKSSEVKTQAFVQNF
jgi:hypothetical protein